jgi:hypothetical protein
VNKARLLAGYQFQTNHQTGIQSKMYKTSNKNSATRWCPGKPVLLLAIMMTGAFLAACAGKAPVPQSPEVSIADRAQDRWEALLAGDFETAWGYYSPGFRSTTSVIDLAFVMRSRRVRWTSAQYKEHSCLENSCTVIFDMGFTVYRPVPGMNKWDGSDRVEEKWVKTDGQWWFLPKK